MEVKIIKIIVDSQDRIIELVDSNRRVLTRNEVVKLIEGGHKFETYVSINGQFKGDSIHVYEIRGEKYLRTDGNYTEVDNLGELPKEVRR